MSESQYPTSCLRVLELFAGIGGLHWALKVASVPCEVIAAMEINPTVLEVYRYNFKETNVVTKNLQGITAEEINKLNVDAIVMSPPCQPFCRMGNRMDVEDNRTGPLSHITEILKEVKFSYIFVENVQGFEDSTARENLLEVLKKLNFKWQEFMLTPKTIGVPNSRLRYYLIGKQQDLPWTFNLSEGVLLSDIPNWTSDAADKMPYAVLRNQHNLNIFSRRHLCKKMKLSASENPVEISSSIGDILDWDMTEEDNKKLILPNSILKKYYQAMDIVTPSSSNTCCFTKGYGHFVKGTGSILDISEGSYRHESDPTNPHGSDYPLLRYFSPKEISRLMSYPEEFRLPQNLSRTQMYKSLGNSVNVYVVAILFSLLFSKPDL